MSVDSEILEICEHLPGSSSDDIIALMPHCSKSTIFARLAVLSASGALAVERRPGRGGGGEPGTTESAAA